MMTGIRNRSTWSSLSSIPRLGFLLFILALAIVVWPKLRPTRVGIQAEIPEMEGARELSANMTGSLSTVTEDGRTDGRTDGRSDGRSDGRTDGLDSEKNLSPEISLSLPDRDLALDGQTRDLLSLVTDNTLRMAKREMPAYWELVRKTSNSSFNDLRKESNSKTKFNDFYSQPAKHRGELVSLDIVVRRVTRFDAEDGNPAGVSSVYEIWGSTDQSHAWLYVFITDKLPNGFDESTLLRTKASFAGYFLKLLAYHPGSSSPNAKPLVAPLLVGQFNDIPQTMQAAKSDFPLWEVLGLTAIVAFVAIYFSVRFFLIAKQKERRRLYQRKELADTDLTLFESDPV